MGVAVLFIRLLGLVILICGIQSDPAVAAWSSEARIARALEVTVQVETERSPGAAFGGRLAPAAPGGYRPGQMAEPRGGAGFIFAAEGLIATNAHVLSGASAFAVRLHDGRRFPARLVGADPTLDLAVLRIDTGAPLPFARLGDSGEAREGAPVWAIGAPMGYAFSVSAGVISGRDRFYDETYPVRLLQHDAALNPGNSGGPLFDAAGRVIGINTATPSDTLFDIGIGLAIPAEVAGPALARLARDGRIERGRLGLSVTAADADVAAAIGAPVAGLIVDGLTDSGAARRDGLAIGDLIVGVGAVAVATPRDLTMALLEAKPGDTATVRYVRDGIEATAMVTLEGDPAPSAAVRSARSPAAEAPLDLGLRLGPSDWNGGVSVLSVMPDSPAALYGLRAGDRLWAVNGRRPASAADALALMRIAQAQVALLRIERPGDPPRHLVLPLTRAAAAKRPPGRVSDSVFGLF